MSFSKKIVAFDLDGTLAVSKQPLSNEMGELLGQLIGQVKVAVISGCSFSQFEKQFLPFLPNSGLNKQNLILLPTSGSRCYEYDLEISEWKMVDEVALPKEMKYEIVRALQTIISSPQFDVPTQRWGEIIEDRETQITFSALGQSAPIEEKRKWDPDQKKRQRIKAELEKILPEVTIGIGGTTSIDILAKGFDKEAGLKRLLSRLNYELSDMVFVGDAVFPGGNDYSVLEAGIETFGVSGPQETAKIIETWLF